MISPADLQIYVPRPLLEEIADYAGRDLQRVRGGFILGYAGHSTEERFVEGRAHVAAEAGVGDGVNFRFTEASFKELAAQKDGLWPDTTVIGWYYTHLGSGIFLSTTDLESHRRAFNLPHQFVLVLDPTQGGLGFFQWRGDRVVPCGFHLFDPA